LFSSQERKIGKLFWVHEFMNYELGSITWLWMLLGRFDVYLICNFFVYLKTLVCTTSS
jgi:hypothetical protein